MSKELPRSLGEVSGRWALVRIAGDIERRRWPGSSPVPKPTVDRPLSLPTFRVDSMSNVVRATESPCRGMRLGSRSTAQVDGAAVGTVHQMSRPNGGVMSSVPTNVGVFFGQVDKRRYWADAQSEKLRGHPRAVRDKGTGGQGCASQPSGSSK
jgi:hypothetical protein